MDNTDLCGPYYYWFTLNYKMIRINIYFRANLKSEIGWKFNFRPNLVKQVVYEGKFKLFDPSVARVKKCEFARVNHKFDQFRSEIQFPTVFRPQICLNIVL